MVDVERRDGCSCGAVIRIVVPRPDLAGAAAAFDLIRSTARGAAACVLGCPSVIVLG